MGATKTLTVRIKHRSSIPNALWCEPIGWEPANLIDGDWIDGGWWGETEEVAGLVYFGQANDGDVIDAAPDDLRVASCGDCRVIGPVELG